MREFFFRRKTRVSQKKPRSRRGVCAIAAVILALCGTLAWGETYYWTGNASNDDWNDVANWSTDNPATATPPFATVATAPYIGDTAIFNDSNTHSFTNDIEVDKITVASGVVLELSGTDIKIGEIENAGTLKIDSASDVTIPTITNSDAIQNISTGKVTITALTNNSANTIENNGGTFTITTLTMAADTTVTNTAGNTTIGTLSGGTANYTATLERNGGSIIVNGYSDKPSIISKGGYVNLYGGELKSLTFETYVTAIKGEIIADDVNVTNNAIAENTTEAKGALVVNNTLINNGRLGRNAKALNSIIVHGTTTNNVGASILTTGDQTYTGAVTNDGSMEVGGNLTVNGTTTNSGAIKSTGAGATVTFGADFTNTGTFTTAADANIIVNGDGDIKINTGTTALEVASVTYKPISQLGTNKLKITNSAITNSLGSFTATENAGNATVNIDCQSTFSTFISDILNELNFTKTNTFGDFTVSGNTKVTFDKGNTFNGKFEFTGDSDPTHTQTAELTLSGANTFNNGFTFTYGNKLIVNAEQTISGTFDISGKDSDNLLTIDGTGYFTGVTAGQKAKYLTVSDVYINTSSASATVVCTAFYSKYSDPAVTGSDHNGWRIIGDTITWTGATDTTWNDENNWEPKIVPGVDNSGSGGDDTTGFNVVIPDSLTNYPILAAVDYFVESLEISGKVTFSGDGRIKDNSASPVPINDTVNNGTVEYSGSGQTIEDFTADGGYANLVIAATSTIISGGDIKVISTAKILGEVSAVNSLEVTGTTEINANIETVSTQTYNDTVTINSNVTLAGTEITFSDDVTVGSDGATFNANVTLDSGKTMSVGAGATVIFGGDFTNNGDYSGNGSKITFEGNFDNSSGTFYDTTAEIIATGTNATIDGGTGITAKSFEYKPSDSSGALSPSGATIEIKGNNTFDAFTAEDLGGATLTVEDKQTINTTLTLLGNGKTTPLTIAGSGQFNLPPTPIQSAKFLTIETTAKIGNLSGNTLTGTDYLCKALFSEYSDGTTGIQNGWFIVGDTITWTGKDTTNPNAWNEKNNWDAEMVPGVVNSNPDDDTTGYKVVIPVKYPVETGADITNFPVTNTEYTIVSLKIGGDVAIPDSTVTGVPSVTLGADNIKLTDTTLPLENYGKIIYSDAGRITDDAATPKPINDLEHKGTVQYSGTTTLTDFASGDDDDYFNLIIYSSAAVTVSEHIVVKNKSSLKASSTVTIPDTVSIKFKGDIESDGATIDGSVFVFGNGNTISGDLTIKKDLIILGTDYKIADAESGVTDLFAYKHTGRKSSASYTGDFPNDFTAFTGVLSVASGTTISVGKNFYANGIEITGTGTWTLKIPDNDSQTAAFAEMYNSSISNCTVTPSSGTQAFVAAAENCTETNCTGIETKRMEIKEAKMIYDDVLKVTFAYSDGTAVIIENSNNEIADAFSNIKFGGNVEIFVFTDEACTDSVPAGDYSNGSSDTVLYLKAATPWNTDATGISAGYEDSTDRNGKHSETIPYLNIPKALDTLYETLRDNHKNRIAHYYSASPDKSAMSSDVGKTYTQIEDNCAPVLIAVYTGQENHVNGTAQPYYDAHNFIEFRYSEPVDISDGIVTILDSDENVQANTFGALTSSSGITIEGLGTISSGKVDAALKSGSGSPHALYRKFSIDGSGTAKEQPCRIRISIAGYVDGTVAGGYKNWAGYINSAGTVCPTAGDTVTIAANDNIVDRAKKADGTPIKNSIYRIAPTGGRPVPTVKVNPTSSGLYGGGGWDVTPPTFAPLRRSGTEVWTALKPETAENYEAVGMGGGSGYLNTVEIHLFDNVPSYASSENPQWFSRIGWALVDAGGNSHGTVQSEAADIVGGARPFSGNRTSGGIRYCTVYNTQDAFTYSIDDGASYKNFSSVQQNANSPFFNYINGDGNPIGNKDGLYLSLKLDSSDSELTGETIFSIKFDSTNCFVTDLAGNLIKWNPDKVMKSIDRAPPTFTLTAAPLGKKQMLVVFSKKLNVGTLDLYSDSSTKISVQALQYIPKSLKLKTASGTGAEIEIDDSVPAKVLFRTEKSTGLAITLKKEVVLNDIINGIRIETQKGDYNYDHNFGAIGEITYIQDDWGNYIRANSKHAFSDFAVDAVQMQYAYVYNPNEGDDESVKFDEDLASRLVREWGEDQGRDGIVGMDREIIMHAQLYDGTSNNSGGLDTSKTITAYFDISPDPLSISNEFNKATEKNWRIWLPNVSEEVFSSLATANNAPQLSLDGFVQKTSHPTDKQFVNFDIPKETVIANWARDDQVQFIFKLGDYEVEHDADGTKSPLYCLRLANPDDLTSLDLWSFKIGIANLQRGGVTILNNVINVNAKEETTVQVELSSPGNLTVMVMTLDGSIVKYLQHGRAEAGINYYTWDGTNKGGSPVARGLYFVRVIGSGIDETRKVMCVKK